MEETATSTHLGFRERWITTGLVGIGLIVFAINGSTTNLILAKIMTNMRVELYQIHWVITAFGIARTVSIPTLGWLSGRTGPRTLYLLSIGTFCLGTLGSALAWDWPSLIAFRILAGAGGGFIPPLSMAIFYQIFPPGQRGMAVGFSLMGWSIGPSIGPLLGGYLVQFASWRVIYVMILPLACTAFLLAWWFLPTLRSPARRRLDYYGLFTMAIFVSTLILGLSRGNREGWDSQYILTLLAIAGVSGIIFIIIELCHPEPLVELRLFRHFPFVMAICVTFLTTMAFRSTGPMIPVLMQRLLGFEPLQVAWTLMPANIIYGITVLDCRPSGRSRLTATVGHHGPPDLRLGLFELRRDQRVGYRHDDDHLSHLSFRCGRVYRRPEQLDRPASLAGRQGNDGRRSDGTPAQYCQHSGRFHVRRGVGCTLRAPFSTACRKCTD